MQDFTGVPAVVDLAAMRDAVAEKEGNVDIINPLVPVDLVIDHSVIVDKYGNETSYQDNVNIEVKRNFERYSFLKWAQHAFDGLRVVPPGTGICHQVNLEYLAEVVCERDGNFIPDTLVGTDSHTTMVNGLGVLGWGVGGIEAEAAMLGQPISMNIPQVVGVHLTGSLVKGVTATDLVLTITEILRNKGVVGKFVEFCGPGASQLTLAERATIANMAPEYGATCGIFPVDEETLNYLRMTGRSEEKIADIKEYLIKNQMWDMGRDTSVVFSDTVHLDLTTVRPCLAGPKRPQDRVDLSDVKKQMIEMIGDRKPVSGQGLNHGDVVIAAITSCTNTSNPSVLVAAGLIARKAKEKGLKPPSWVKTSIAPGSKVVTAYLDELGLTDDLNALGFYNVGYGCTTCIGNSGPLDDQITKKINEDQVLAASVLSGNRNFEGRIHPLSEANWLASPPLVVAYAIAGTTLIDFEKDPIGFDQNKDPVMLADLWPEEREIADMIRVVRRELFTREYDDVFTGGPDWSGLQIQKQSLYDWSDESSYIQRPEFFKSADKSQGPSNINGARILAILGDSVTTDHISPAGVIKPDSPAGHYLMDHGISAADFNSYGSRRGNFEVMVRGTFANIRIQNMMTPDIRGGYTRHYPSGEMTSIYDAAMKYQASDVPSVVFAGKEYGTGSSRDWAAKGTLLLGVKAVITGSFERIHRSNLIGMGVLPCQFLNDSVDSLGLKGDEVISITGIDQITEPGAELGLHITYSSGEQKHINMIARLDTLNEIVYFKRGGILKHVMENLLTN